MSNGTNKDQDLWHGGTGEGDSKPTFDIFTGVPIQCRRSCLDCAGFYACEQVDRKFLLAERYELDPKSLLAIIEAQVQDRAKEANSTEKLVLTSVAQLNLYTYMSLTSITHRFWFVIQAQRCDARDGTGARCSGSPVMKAYKVSNSICQKLVIYLLMIRIPQSGPRHTLLLVQDGCPHSGNVTFTLQYLIMLMNIC